MRHDYSSVKNIYIICGKTDMRKGIDGLATLIQDSFELDPYGDSIFLFSGWSCVWQNKSAELCKGKMQSPALNFCA
jgi:transposase